MENFIRIGHLDRDLDRVRSVKDVFARQKKDKLAIRFGPGEGDAYTFTGQEADDPRTWLNSTATNARTAIHPDSAT